MESLHDFIKNHASKIFISLMTMYAFEKYKRRELLLQSDEKQYGKNRDWGIRRVIR